MHQITIYDPLAYQAGEAFARAHNSTLSELVNKYVASLASKALPHTKKGSCVMDTKEFQDAMEYMDTLVADDLATPVPADENGSGAMLRIKYGL
jgi:hypothetical protein